MDDYVLVMVMVATDGGDDHKWSGRTLPVSRKVLDRLVQEEIWAQTVWPVGEVTLAGMLNRYYKTD